MKKYLLLLFAFGCITGTVEAQGTGHRVPGVYRMHMGERDGFDVWVVDGATVRREIYPEFLYGGNPQRYLFVPRREIWIDNAIACEEYGYTLAHELRERNLMAQKGMSYDDAHTMALDLEQTMRRSDDSSARAHERELPLVSPTDSDNEKEIAGVPDSIRIRNIYRVPLGTRNKIAIWIVDGAAVRRDVYPDFGLSGNDLAYHFIPPREIWIDGQISCEETEFSIAIELYERQLMTRGTSYDRAYEQALAAIDPPRKRAADNARRKPAIVIPRALDRSKGTGDEK